MLGGGRGERTLAPRGEGMGERGDGETVVEARQARALDEGQVRGPALEAVEDVRAVDDSGAARGAVVAQEEEEVTARDDVQVGCCLVQQRNLDRKSVV